MENINFEKTFFKNGLYMVINKKWEDCNFLMCLVHQALTVGVLKYLLVLGRNRIMLKIVGSKKLA